VAWGEGAVRLASTALSIEVDGLDAAACGHGEMLLGVRPHDIDLVPGGGGDGSGTVEIVEPLGPATVVHLRMDGAPQDLVRVVAAPDTRTSVGERCGFRLRRDRVHVFAGDTGRRMNS